MKPVRLLLPLALLIALLSVVFFVRATCVPSDTGTAGNDTITCDTANPPASDVEGQAGNDTILIDTGVVAGSNVSGGNVVAVNEGGSDLIVNNGTVNSDIYGDSSSGVGTGNDIIVNNGTVNSEIMGDSNFNDGSGDDIIINNGTVVSSVYGDSFNGNGSGNDTLINNGTVNNIIYGDSFNGNGTGNDTIINNGTAQDLYGDGPFGAIASGSDTIINNGTLTQSIYGDSFSGASSGNDVIVNNGTVSTNIYGDDQAGGGSGSDTITNGGTVNGSILAGGGSDLVVIGTNTAQVGGTINGGAGYDTLTFNLTSTDPAVLLDAAQRIAAANPNGGTITLGGHTYTWLNFEELSRFIFSMTRLNGLMDSLAVFCALSGGVDVYLVSGQQGFFSLNVSTQTISNGLTQAINSRVRVGLSSTASVYALPTGEIEVTAPNGFRFSFIYQNYCGTLPPASEGEPNQVEAGVEPPPYSIINQPYEG